MRGGSTSKFFSTVSIIRETWVSINPISVLKFSLQSPKNSSTPEKAKIWENMQKWNDVLKASNDDGIAAVREKPGKYAFFMESTIIEYNMERKCGLAQVGGLLDNKGYGIALRKGTASIEFLNKS